MKNIQLHISLIITFLLSTAMFANNSEKISSMSRDVLVEPSKNGATVTIDMYFKHPESIQEMTIERGTILGETFRQVKVFGANEIASIADGKISTVDKYPLAASDANVYYRVVVVDKEGFVRFFPASSIQDSYSASAK